MSEHRSRSCCPWGRRSTSRTRSAAWGSSPRPSSIPLETSWASCTTRPTSRCWLKGQRGDNVHAHPRPRAVGQAERPRRLASMAEAQPRDGNGCLAGVAPVDRSSRPRLQRGGRGSAQLCWVDGQAAGVDEERSKQYFTPRRARYPWSGLNKERFQWMLLAGRVAPAGIAAVERAKADGSWSILDPVERLEVPADLAAALDARPPARSNWEAFPPSARRALLADRKSVV